MIKGEDQVVLVREKFKECESYFNEMEKVFYNSEGDVPPEQAIPKLAMMTGKLMTNFADIATLLEIFGSTKE